MENSRIPKHKRWGCALVTVDHLWVCISAERLQWDGTKINNKGFGFRLAPPHTHFVTFGLIISFLSFLLLNETNNLYLQLIKHTDSDDKFKAVHRIKKKKSD